MFLRGHEQAVYCVVITPDGKTLVSGSADKTIEIWST
jgi:WD40 repeat protein